MTRPEQAADVQVNADDYTSNRTCQGTEPSWMHRVGGRASVVGAEGLDGDEDDGSGGKGEYVGR